MCYAGLKGRCCSTVVTCAQKPGVRFFSLVLIPDGTVQIVHGTGVVCTRCLVTAH